MEDYHPRLWGWNVKHYHPGIQFEASGLEELASTLKYSQCSCQFLASPYRNKSHWRLTKKMMILGIASQTHYAHEAAAEQNQGVVEFHPGN